MGAPARVLRDAWPYPAVRAVPTMATTARAWAREETVMKILVAYATRHGATQGIAERG